MNRLTEAPFVCMPPRRLDDLGRCCGRKPIAYKRPAHRLFCYRCCAEYAPDGTQRPNWAWRATQDGFVSTYPDNGNHDYVSVAGRAALAQEGGGDGK